MPSIAAKITGMGVLIILTLSRICSLIKYRVILLTRGILSLSLSIVEYKKERVIHYMWSSDSPNFNVVSYSHSVLEYSQLQALNSNFPGVSNIILTEELSILGD